MAERDEAGPGRLAEVAGDHRRGEQDPRRAPRRAGGAPGRPAACRAATCSSPAGRRTSRSIPCATSPTAPRASRATPSRAAAAALGARVTLVTGPVSLPDPAGVAVVHVETAERDAARGADEPAGRYRHIRGRGRRLALGIGAAREDQEVRRQAAASTSSRTPTSWPPSASRARSGRRSSSALPPRPATSPAKPRRSASPRAPTGSSPTMCRRRAASSAATATPCISSPPTASRTGRR